ncbi:MAG: T9SS type A sorting domain-containing protein [Saprospiraceae bacterium]|nr:T9SS type A sorting domain-containing protein [Saprospiraceae bacterium]
MKKTFALILLFLVTKLFSQITNSHWALGSNLGDSHARIIEVAKSGNIYVKGEYNTEEFELGGYVIKNPVFNPYASFIAKLNSDGKVLWLKNFDQPTIEISGLTLDSDENIIITGGFAKDYPPKFDTIQIAKPLGATATFITKYTSDGIILWAKSISGTLTEVFPQAGIIVDFNNKLYFAGSYNSANVKIDSFDLINRNYPSNEIFIVCLSSEGKTLWANQFGGDAYEIPNTITYDGNNHFILSGYFHSKSVKFDSFEIFRTPSKDPIPWYGDIFVVKFTLDGKVVWANSVNGISNKGAHGAWSDGSENTYLFGTSESDTLIIGQTRILLKGAKGYSDCFFCKYDPSGKLIYAKTFDDGIAGGLSGLSGSVLQNGDFYIIGLFDSTVAKVDNIALPYYGNVTDIFVLKYNKDGECLMGKSIGSNGADVIGSMKVDSEENIYCVGSYSGNKLYSCGDTLVNPYLFNGITGSDTSPCYIFKLNKLILDNKDLPQSTKAVLYPNPTKDLLHFYIDSYQDLDNVEIINLEGKSTRLEYKQNNSIFELNISRFNPGIYFLKIKCDDHSIIEKFIIN